MSDEEIENEYFSYVRTGHLGASIRDFKAGFRKAIELIEARWPRDSELILIADDRPLTFPEWLRDKIFGKGAGC